MNAPAHSSTAGPRPVYRSYSLKAGLIVLLLVFGLVLQGCSTSSKYFFLVDTPEGITSPDPSGAGGVEAGGKPRSDGESHGSLDGDGNGAEDPPPAEGGAGDNGNGEDGNGEGGNGSGETDDGEDGGDGSGSKGDDEDPRPELDQIYTISPRSHRLLSDEDEDLKVVLLTIDDGPRGALTERMLEVLDEYDMPALFFVNGTHFEMYGDNIKQIHAHGHEVANHGWSHRQLRGLGEQSLKDEIERTSLAIEELTGHRPRFFRPAYGTHSERSAKMTADLEMQSVNWSIDPRDWDRQGAAGSKAISDHIVEHLHPGAVILIHQLDVTMNALPDIAEGVRAAGYRFVHPGEIAPTVETDNGGGGGG